MNTQQENQIIEQALSILEARTLKTSDALTSADDVRSYLALQLTEVEHEVFVVIFMNNRNQVIEFNQMFRGTINGASVYPREVVKQALKVNAAAVIFAHNHPSGIAEPSQADRSITNQLATILDIIDVRVLDHFIVGGANTYSFTENGLL